MAFNICYCLDTYFHNCNQNILISHQSTDDHWKKFIWLILLYDQMLLSIQCAPRSLYNTSFAHCLGTTPTGAFPKALRRCNQSLLLSVLNNSPGRLFQRNQLYFRGISTCQTIAFTSWF